MAGVFVVRCDRPASGFDGRLPALTRHFGPFYSATEANAHVMLEDYRNICDGKHTVIEIEPVPVEQNVPLSLLGGLIREEQTKAKQAAIRDLAAATKPFTAGREHNDPDGEVIINGIFRGKITTIKELRNRFPGLGLKEAKDIVDQWQAAGLVDFSSSAL